MSMHEDKTNDCDFDHDGLSNENTEKDNAAGPLMDRANPLHSSQRQALILTRTLYL
jgi:hypothetical protein